jgi:hypothetical protein
MSAYYEIVFSLFIRDNTGDEELDALRWHLGLSEQRPEECAIGTGYPLLRPHDGSALPGGDVVAFQRQRVYGGGRTHAWGLYTRLYWLDDTWANHWIEVATWLVSLAASDGYAGYFREETDEQPGLLLLVRDGKPYACRPGEEPFDF